MKNMRVKAGLRILMAGLLAATVWGAVAYSQSGPVARGKFSLPFEAQWGKLDLQPGNYSFDVKAENSSYIVTVEQGARPLGFVLTTTFASQEATGSQDQALLCVRHSGECSIGALKMSNGVFYFALPGGQRAQFAKQPDLIERVPVLFAQK